MPRTPSPHSPRNPFSASGGFTFLEVLVTLFLLAVLAAVLAAGIRGAQTVIGRVTTSASGSIALAQLDQALRQHASAVRIPFWVRDIDVSEEQGTLRIPFLHGEEEYMLLLDRRTYRDARIGERTRLLIGSEPPHAGLSQPVLSFGPFRTVGIAVQRDAQGVPWGLKLTVLPEDGSPGTPIEMVARFGGTPF